MPVSAAHAFIRRTVADPALRAQVAALGEDASLEQLVAVACSRRPWRLPPSPSQFEKAILRTIGDGLLPDDIVRRPKTVFGVNPGWEAARRGLEPWLVDLPHAAELDGYIDRKRLAGIVADIGSLPPQEYSSAVMLPAGLAAWLRRERQLP